MTPEAETLTYVILTVIQRKLDQIRSKQKMVTSVAWPCVRSCDAGREFMQFSFVIKYVYKQLFPT